MSDEPETLEQTQARLSAGARDVVVPPPAPAAPVSPYGPPTPPAGGAPPAYTAPAPGYDPVYPPVVAAAPRDPRAIRRGLVIVGVVLLVVAVAVFTIYSVTSAASNAQWATYPGTAYRDSDEALNSDSLEAVMAAGSGAIAEFRQTLTDELGMEWTEIYDETIDHDYNYYGGESMLYFWDSGLLEGSVATDDPDARQKIQDAFERVTNAAGGQNFYVWNDMLDEGDEFTEEYYGLGGKDTQAIWALGNRDDDSGVSFSADIFDRDMPVGETFHGDYAFDIDPDNPNNLFVQIFVSAPALLSEADRAEFIERLKPFEGLTKPDATD
ncbi:hypothetical protein BH10ACT7_BH10ACT7_19200 [soil metagenome]